ncbi:MAG: RDD family protein [Bacteroidales bacterium]|nr:RDD family protein [Bacteroidales bacterium]
MMEQEANSFIPEDIKGDPAIPEFIKEDDIEKIKQKRDYSNVYELPSLRTRFFSILLDGVSIVILAYLCTLIFESIGEVPDYMRKVAFLFCFILYEPILVSFGATIGQSMMNIRVRSFSNPEKKLNIAFAVVRTFVKFLLGWLSFITISFNPNRRAIHDMASGSIMITKTKSTKQASPTLP